MARANGIPASEVYVVNASRQSTRVSANVSGFLGTERITLNDNLLNRCTLPEIESTMGHEMGHYVLNHVYKGTLFFGVLTVLGFAFLRGASGRALTRRGDAWRLRGKRDLPKHIKSFVGEKSEEQERDRRKNRTENFAVIKLRPSEGAKQTDQQQRCPGSEKQKSRPRKITRDRKPNELDQRHERGEIRHQSQRRPLPSPHANQERRQVLRLDDHLCCRSSVD